MKKKFIYWVILVVLVFVLAYFIFSSSIFDNVRNKASLSEMEATTVLDDVKTYVTNNIKNYEDGTIIFTKNDLLVNSIIKEDSKLDKTSRVYVIVNAGLVTDAYIKNRSINNYLMNEVSSSNFVSKDNSYFYVGENADNYIMFNNGLYRIMKVNSDGNLLIINNDKEEVVNKNKIDAYIQMFKNRKYYSYVKNVTLLNISDYNNTILNDKTYLESNYKYFVNTSNGYEVVNALTETDEEAALKLVVEIDKDASYEKGVGTIVDPIIISE
ncbi:MAG: hypothetical protein IKZ96_03540 [Bacilli bacterium]|nr:hypothetical protein [Bacilli bacterium]